MTDLSLPHDMRNLVRQVLWVSHQTLSGLSVEYGSEVAVYMVDLSKLEKRVHKAGGYGDKTRRRWRKQLRMADAILRAADCLDVVVLDAD